MKIIHIESGFGNQMLSYCECLALKKMNPDDEFYLETIIYDIPECNDIICQWNGYELERIFGIKTPPNIKTLFSADEWEAAISDIRDTRFWEHNWNWPVYFEKVFNKHGLIIKNTRGNFTKEGLRVAYDVERKKEWKDYIRGFDWYKWLKAKKDFALFSKKAQEIDNTEIHFRKTDENILDGQRLSFKWKGSGIERIEKEVREAFTFPKITDNKNQEAMLQILSENAVAIHARRGDMAGYNYDCYRFGYFNRCMKFIRSQVSEPVFYIFCDPGSVTWAKENYKILGLDGKKDKIHFVDWNKGEDSYRDMQLMAACKHQVITRSSFGWWGAWLNTFPGKITCSPDPRINTTHSF